MPAGLPQVVPNFSLKSLIGSWAERHKIAGAHCLLACVPAGRWRALPVLGPAWRCPDNAPA